MARLLVVDDSSLTRRMLVSLLKENGHMVVEAGDGGEGLVAFQQGEFDAVFSDLLMPVSDGFEMCEAIRSLAPSVPIIITSADIREKSRERCEAIGVTRIIRKPFKVEQVLDVLERLPLST